MKQSDYPIPRTHAQKPPAEPPATLAPPMNGTHNSWSDPRAGKRDAPCGSPICLPLWRNAGRRSRRRARGTAALALTSETPRSRETETTRGGWVEARRGWGRRHGKGSALLSALGYWACHCASLPRHTLSKWAGPLLGLGSFVFLRPTRPPPLPLGLPGFRRGRCPTLPYW